MALLKVGDRVRVKKDIDGNNTKDKVGTVKWVDETSEKDPLTSVEFDEKCKQGHDGNKKSCREGYGWNIYAKDLVKLEDKQTMKKTKGRAKVTLEGKEIIIPAGMSYDVAIEEIRFKKQEEEQEIEIVETINAFVWDGALALQRAMRETYGWSKAVESKGGFFGMETKPPKMLEVETGIDSTTLVPVGDFKLPNISGTISTGMTEKRGKVVFMVRAIIKRKHESAIRKLFDLTRKYAKEESIYKGKALKIRFTKQNDEGDRVSDNFPMPQFIDVESLKSDEVVFSEAVEKSVAINILTPVTHTEHCRKAGIPLKRGILLNGVYGVGKTLLAKLVGQLCVKNGWTFLMVESADEIKHMVAFARDYMPAVVFCEDIDRVVSGERTLALDDILNTVDGIESKGAEIMVILTTNHASKINKAMLRPGRLDAIINITPPDSKAVERLLHVYGRDLIRAGENLEAVGVELDGKIPAVIRECIERAKLSAIRTGGEGALQVTAQDLLDASVSMRNQLELLDASGKAKIPQVAEVGVAMARLIQDITQNGADSLKEAEATFDNSIERS